jgi:hypothetical protein
MGVKKVANWQSAIEVINISHQLEMTEAVFSRHIIVIGKKKNLVFLGKVLSSFTSITFFNYHHHDVSYVSSCRVLSCG